MNQGKVISGFYVEVIERKVQRDWAEAEKVLAKFAEDVRMDPTRAFEWSKEKFEAAAILDLYSHLLSNMREDKFVWEGVYLRFLERVADKARFIENSTSPQAVYMERANLAALAKFCEILKWNREE